MHISAQTDLDSGSVNGSLHQQSSPRESVAGTRPSGVPNGTSSKTWWLIHVRKGLPQQPCRTPRSVRGARRWWIAPSRW